MTNQKENNQKQLRELEWWNIISAKTFHLFAKEKNGVDIIAVYLFIYHTAKFQQNKITYCTTKFIARGLKLTEARVRKARKYLKEKGFIEDIINKKSTTRKDRDGNIILKKNGEPKLFPITYTDLKYFPSKENEKEIVNKEVNNNKEIKNVPYEFVSDEFVSNEFNVKYKNDINEIKNDINEIKNDKTIYCFHKNENKYHPSDDYSVYLKEKIIILLNKENYPSIIVEGKLSELEHHFNYIEDDFNNQMNTLNESEWDEIHEEHFNEDTLKEEDINILKRKDPKLYKMKLEEYENKILSEI